jgi:CBS domain-containing protein
LLAFYLLDEESMEKAPKFLWMRVGEVMRRNPPIVTPDTQVEEILNRMEADPCFLVVEGGKLVGIVTESDVLQLFSPIVGRAMVGGDIGDVRKRFARTVRELMTPNPLSVSPQETVEQALRLMLSRKLRHLPVVEKGKAVGLLTLRDIIAAYRAIR